jgi:hypothetical protein
MLHSMFSLPSLTITKPEQVIASVSAHGNYDTVYKLFCSFLDLPPSGGMHFFNPLPPPKKTNLDFVDMVVDDYLFYTVWTLLHQLPPSAQFLSDLKNPKLFRGKVSFWKFFGLKVI